MKKIAVAALVVLSIPAFAGWPKFYWGNNGSYTTNTFGPNSFYWGYDSGGNYHYGTIYQSSPNTFITNDNVWPNPFR